MKKIDLAKESGEFCVRRNDSNLVKIKSYIQNSIDSNSTLEIDWNNVKILTPSYIDELIPDFIIKYGAVKINSLILFNPPLTGFLAHQVVRGSENRLVKPKSNK